jgi:hypothetical protein
VTKDLSVQKVSKEIKVRQDLLDLVEKRVPKVTHPKEVKESQVLRSKDPKDLRDLPHKDPKAIKV